LPSGGAGGHKFWKYFRGRERAPVAAAHAPRALRRPSVPTALQKNAPNSCPVLAALTIPALNDRSRDLGRHYDGGGPQRPSPDASAATIVVRGRQLTVPIKGGLP
jgi:hypothetical protein